MKKVILILSLLIASYGFAQENSAFKKDAEKLVEINSMGQFEAAIDPLVKMIPEENKEAFMKEIDSVFDEMKAEMVTLQMEYFTHKEIKEILKFYDTKVGKKMREVQPTLTKKGMEIGQRMAPKMMPIVQKYME
ncbi:MAG: DUF2059 domain-containing protein [Bacteroidota bacterium]